MAVTIETEVEAIVAPKLIPCSSPEWPNALDASALRSTGWHPWPFRQFILKLHSRCNLACTYCYIYTLKDQSWRGKPHVMSTVVQHRTADRIAEHITAHRLGPPTVVLHGGEPLLAGAAAVSDAADVLRNRVGEVDLRVQTNGVLLDKRMVQTLAAHGIKVGLSLDGALEDNDRHRTYRDGRGSFKDVVHGFRELKAVHPELLSGLLCTVDLDSDPTGCYEELLKLEPPVIDLLLPHGNWSSPPPGMAADAPYGRWLACVFDRWYGSGATTEIRSFQEIITLILGGNSRIESIGLSPVTLLVIDTNGDLEQVDTLRSAYDGAAQTGLNVFRNSFDDALEHPGVMFRQAGKAALAEECLACPVVDVCGAGYWPHRYKAGAGFRQPSVYCRDLKFLIDHIADRLRADLTAALAQQGAVGPSAGPAGAAAAG